MVLLHTCIFCKQGQHDKCLGHQPPINQMKGGPMIMGGSSCICYCRRQLEEQMKFEEKDIQLKLKFK